MNSAALDFLLYYDEDQDIDEDAMTEYSPVEAAHVRELIERELLEDGEVFSHKGWHHYMLFDEGAWYGAMWDGPSGEERRYIAEYDEWEQ